MTEGLPRLGQERHRGPAASQITHLGEGVGGEPYASEDTPVVKWRERSAWEAIEASSQSLHRLASPVSKPS